MTAPAPNDSPHGPAIRRHNLRWFRRWCIAITGIQGAIVAFNAWTGSLPAALSAIAYIPLALVGLQCARDIFREAWWQGRVDVMNALSEGLVRGLSPGELVGALADADTMTLADKRWPR